MRMLRWVCSLLIRRPSTDDRDKVSLKSTIIFNTHCRFFHPGLSPCVVLASDWLKTFSHIFSDLLQHFCDIDTVDTKMLASNWLLFIAANQKPEFWFRYGCSISPTTLLLALLITCFHFPIYPSMKTLCPILSLFSRLRMGCLRLYVSLMCL